MPTTDERLASLEARMDRIDDLFTLVGELRADMKDFRADMNMRLVALDTKVDRDFRTLIATQVAVLIAVVSALMGAYFR